jgi:hypothetical protein
MAALSRFAREDKDIMDEQKYILDENHNIAPVDWGTWAKWYKESERHVGLTRVGGVEVSTVFLSDDHNFGDSDRPVLFETLVFGGELDGERERYCTWQEAEAGHEAMVARVRNAQEVTP